MNSVDLDVKPLFEQGTRVITRGSNPDRGKKLRLLTGSGLAGLFASPGVWHVAVEVLLATEEAVLNEVFLAIALNQDHVLVGRGQSNEPGS